MVINTLARGTSRKFAALVIHCALCSAAALVGSGCEGQIVDGDAGEPEAPVIVDLELAPVTAAIDVGQSLAFTARVVFSDGTREDRSDAVRWSSSDDRVASVDDTGNVNGLTPGLVQISVATGVLSASSTLTVSGVGPEVLPPQTLEYTSPVSYAAAAPITPNLPTITGGTPELFVVVPSLPSGLFLDSATGALTGTPASITPSVDYTVTASNSAGSATAVVRIQIECDFDRPPDPSLDFPDVNGADSNNDGIDGSRCGPVFVSPNGNASGSGTIDSPLRSLQAAIERASGFNPPRQVYAAGGQYAEHVSLASGVSIFGGYDDTDGWRRNPTHVVEIIGSSPALTGGNISEDIIVDLVSIQARDAVIASANAIAVDLSPSTATITFRRAEFRAGRGGEGLDGAAGNDAPLFGDDGEDGNDGCENSTGLCNTCATPLVGPGGIGTVVGTTGGRGGAGAIGEAPGGGRASGIAGSEGENGAFGGSGGVDGINGGRGGDGEPGGFGLRGTDGAGGGPGLRGLDGQPGTIGGGGGGGGGGMGGTSICDSFGGTGGGGGAGAEAGTGGKGGGAGGSSIGIRIAGSPVVLDSVRIRTDDGGAGGDGGRGGFGGFGGLGGFGGTGFDDSGAGGNGGIGGDGGDGGHGGGGGGGASFGIWADTADGLTQTDVTFTVGLPGQGGASEGTPGENGAAANVQIGAP